MDVSNAGDALFGEIEQQRTHATKTFLNLRGWIQRWVDGDHITECSIQCCGEQCCAASYANTDGGDRVDPLVGKQPLEVVQDGAMVIGVQPVIASHFAIAFAMSSQVIGKIE